MWPPQPHSEGSSWTDSKPALLCLWIECPAGCTRTNKCPQQRWTWHNWESTMAHGKFRNWLYVNKMWERWDKNISLQVKTFHFLFCAFLTVSSNEIGTNSEHPIPATVSPPHRSNGNAHRSDPEPFVQFQADNTWNGSTSAGLWVHSVSSASLEPFLLLSAPLSLTLIYSSKLNWTTKQSKNHFPLNLRI